MEPAFYQRCFNAADRSDLVIRKAAVFLQEHHFPLIFGKCRDGIKHHFPCFVQNETRLAIGSARYLKVAYVGGFSPFVVPFPVPKLGVDLIPRGLVEPEYHRG